MLTEKPWRIEAIARLFAALFVCVTLGVVAQLLLRARVLPDDTNRVHFFALTAGAAVTQIAALIVIGRRLTPETLSIRAALFLGLLFAGLFLCGSAQNLADTNFKDTNLAGFAVQILSFQGVAIPLLMVFVVQHDLGFSQAFGFGNRPGHALLLSAIVGLGLTPVCLGLHEGLGELAQHFDIRLPPQDAVFILQLANSWTHRIVFGIATILIVPLAEEGLFRGVLYPKLKRLMPPSIALMVTSLLFAAIHQNLLSFLPLVVLAIGLTVLYDKTGNLLAPIACHALFNAYNYVKLFQMNNPPAP